VPKRYHYRYRVGAVVPELVVDCTVDEFGEWTARILAMPGIEGDGTTNEEAVERALLLLLHQIIARIHAGRFRPVLTPIQNDTP
jgi:hypothetical protein